MVRQRFNQIIHPMNSCPSINAHIALSKSKNIFSLPINPTNKKLTSAQYWHDMHYAYHWEFSVLLTRESARSAKSCSLGTCSAPCGLHPYSEVGLEIKLHKLHKSIPEKKIIVYIPTPNFEQLKKKTGHSLHAQPDQKLVPDMHYLRPGIHVSKFQYAVDVVFPQS